MSTKKANLISTLIGFIILCILLIKLPIGLANNGDYYRVMSKNNLYFFEKEPQEQFFNYFVKDFGILEYYNEASSENQIITSQNLFIQLAVKLDNLFTGQDYSFDIRFLGFLQILLCTLGLYLFIDFLTYKKSFASSLLIGLFCVIVFTDVSYSTYFNSFYAEGLAYTLFIILFSSILLLFQKRYSPYFLYILILISSLLLVFLKQQYVPIGMILGLLFIYIGYKERSKLLKKAAYISSIILSITSILVYVFIPQEFVDINSYHAMTRGILLTADDPEEALEEFNIYNQYTLLNGETYYTKYPQVDVNTDTFEEDFFSHYGFISVGMYYLKHPNQLSKILGLATKNAYSPRSTVLGNYLAQTGHAPNEQVHFHTFWSRLKSYMVPTSVSFLFIWCLLAILLSLKNKEQMITILSMILIGLSQVGVSIIGAGEADLAKHIFLFSIIFDYINIIGISYLINKLMVIIIPKLSSIKLRFSRTTHNFGKGLSQ